MSSVNAKSAVGRQSQLPLKRAFLISLNSVKIRFWRSIITAGGIFLGIAFFAVVLTQGLMQWPIVEKIDPGFIRIQGQVNAPNDYEVWKPIPVDAGIKAGIPKEVVDRTADGSDTFSLANIVKGQLDHQRDVKMLKQFREEWAKLSKLQNTVAFYVAAATGSDVKISDAVKYGVPKSIMKKVAGKKDTVNGADIADAVRENSAGMNPFYVMMLLDQDISINDGVRAGVPETVAIKLAAEGRTFKTAALNDAITAQPGLIKLWEGREKMNSIYTKATRESINSLDKTYALTLNDIISESKGFAENARKAQVMIVNKDRRVSVNCSKQASGNIRIMEGDNILIPDMNSYYRMWWLLVMSLLVCSVGITNSMLMAVTERFKEIGTMKCLGALDSFVVILFMMESGMMGIIASTLGWIVGFGSIMIIAGVSKGWNILASIQPISILTTFLLSVGVGLLITIIATIAPAMRAANMPAAIALRSEI